MNKQNQIEDVAQITWWNRTDDDCFQARVVYRDGTEGRYDHLTALGWLNMKAAELDYELNELNKTYRRINSSQQNKTTNPYKDIDPENFDIDERAEEIGAYAMQTEHFGLCAWCRSYFDRKTNEVVATLTEKEFEATRHDGTSHTICRYCSNLLKRVNS